MRKLFTLLVVLFATTCLWAYDFEVNGIYYNYLDGNNVEVTYNNSIDAEKYSGEVIIPSTITYNRTTYNVTSIGERAFSQCSSLSSITIPNSVTSIGNSAFSQCSSLSSITIPNSVTSIGYSAFYGCTFTKQNFINNSSLNAQEQNYWEAKIVDEDIDGMLIRNDTIIDCRPYAKSASIPNKITTIGNSAFSDCSSLSSITIPNSVTSIGDWAFSGCSSLSKTNYTGDMSDWCKIKFGINSSNPISQSHNLYINDEEIKDLILPNTIDSIYPYAFEGCFSLTSITIPNSVTSIGDYDFHECYDLNSIIVESGNRIYDSRENCNAIIETKNNTLIVGCKTTIIPNQITTIGKYAFDNCDALTSITLPNNITTIGKGTFSGCSALTEIAIPNSVTYIGESVFEDCVRLGKVQIGSGVETIAENAFAGCRRLYDVYCYATYPPFAEQSSFANYNVYLYVPCESIRNYTLDVVWGNFKFIECIESEDVTTEGVVVTPSTNDVTITWPTEAGADSYTIVIKKGDTVFCTLTFNADGQLLNIAFAPGRNGNHPAQYAEQAGNGYRLTVTGLDEGTHYAYNIDVKDAADKTIKSYTGEFTTESVTSVENIHGSSSITNCQKMIRNGQFVIVRDGVEYTIMGQEL